MTVSAEADQDAASLAPGILLQDRGDTLMQTWDFYDESVRGLQDPPQAEALIGKVALRYREELLNLALPEMLDALKHYHGAVNLCFLDDRAQVHALERLSAAISEFGRVDRLTGCCRSR